MIRCGRAWSRFQSAAVLLYGALVRPASFLLLPQIEMCAVTVSEWRKPRVPRFPPLIRLL